MTTPLMHGCQSPRRYPVRLLTRASRFESARTFARESPAVVSRTSLSQMDNLSDQAFPSRTRRVIETAKCDTMTTMTRQTITTRFQISLASLGMAASDPSVKPRRIMSVIRNVQGWMRMRVSPRLTRLRVLGNGQSIPHWPPAHHPLARMTMLAPLPACHRLRPLHLAIRYRRHNTIRTIHRCRHLNITLPSRPTILLIPLSINLLTITRLPHRNLYPHIPHILLHHPHTIHSIRQPGLLSIPSHPPPIHPNMTTN